MLEREISRKYYGRRSKKGGYDWIVCIDDEGCFITDPIDDWDKDNDYLDEAKSNPVLYDTLDQETAATVLAEWGRSLR
ncbi:MAG TPA: hypothetical protein DHV69_02305 [Sphaerochaeta sp.]|jgi:hypothetical protein|nr:MAG: hypothetical protein A2Y31_13065 [Spirochaetes bacterium GWC2_52_13]OHD61970.1 MAG: hypothetical protein A2101_01095 [Spirochaetes bacterium GWF2_52_7]PKL19884.1 MAG: hypothetical protein CVV48_15745 [Spirochaetae bacterium HGW-Spirochaetae-4]HCG63561.1 hypothetical protein [Sphaerochaeta sp.]HCJ94069.1 hypothetical protein [Sphaerochaeta sp.]